MISKNSSPNPSSPGCSPILSCRRCIVSPFTFRSMISFELIFVNGVKSVSKFFFFPCGCLAVPAPCVGKTILSPSFCLCRFVEDQFMYLVGLFGGYLFCSTDLSILLPVPLCLDYCSSIVSLEVRVHLPTSSSPSILCCDCGFFYLFI